MDLPYRFLLLFRREFYFGANSIKTAPISRGGSKLFN